MTKSLLSIAVAALAFGANALAAQTPAWQDAPQAQWIGMMSGTATSAQEWVHQVIPTADGCQYVLGSAPLVIGDANAAITWNGTKLDVNATGRGTSTDQHVLLFKINQQQEVVWLAYTDYANVTATNLSANSMDLDAEGNIVVAFQVRNNSDEGKNDGTGRMASFTDAKNQVTTLYLPTRDNSQNVENIVIAKFNPEGELLWAKASNNDEGASMVLRAVLVDDQSNIYLGGEVSGKLTFINGNTATDINAIGATIIKLDADGEYIDYMRVANPKAPATAYASAVSLNDLAFCNGKIAFAGNITPAGDVMVGSVIMGCEAATLNGLWYGLIDKDLDNVEYAVYMPATAAADGKHTTQVKALSVGDGTVWVSLGLKGGLSTNGVEVVKGRKNLEGAAVCYDAATGAYLGGIEFPGPKADSNNTLISDIVVAENAVVAFGYDMMGNKGAFLRYYDPETYQMYEDGEYQLMATAGTPTAYGATYDWDNNTVYAIARTNNANTQFYATDYVPEGVHGFDTFVMAYKLDGLQAASGIEGVVVAPEHTAAPVYYNLQGMRVANPAAGQVYIRHDGATATKVLMR